MELCPDVTSTGEECPVGMRKMKEDALWLLSSVPPSPKEESLEDVLQELVQNRPGLLHRLKVIRVESKDIPPSLKQQYSEMLSQDEEFLKDFCKELEQYREDPEPSCVSMKSDQSRVLPPSFNQQHSEETSDVSTDRHSHLDSIFMCLEEKVVGFVKKELKKFKEMLSPDYPECPEDQCEDEGVVDEEEAQRRYSSKLVLDMTLLFMRRMNLGELAASLEKRSMRLIQSVAKNTKQNAAFPGLMSAISLVFSTCFR
ncbi:uncharacterized protein LOC115567352 isoform X2 [Sparus aurata]|uniref:uncharacterized protein LOC115567352 isoform X2 n=1 Tax=Sparus aurata TaxID=8175 RepID=UPI0011C0C8D5|nr:uncharacterized protein LOC115567352 isoform X2 [Sparus aurata]